MRALLVLPLLLVLLPMPVTGQEAAAPLLTDDEGDLDVSIQDVPASDTAGRYTGLDLVSLAVTETSDSFTFTLQVADLKPGSDDRSNEGGQYYALFRHADTEFLLQISMSLPGIQDYAWGSLDSRSAGTQEWDSVRDLEGSITLDYGADTITVLVPRTDLADSSGAAPFPGRTLEGFEVYSEGMFNDAGVYIVTGTPLITVPIKVADRMPNEGIGPSLPIVFGLEQTGHARLASEAPFRASNGEATTLIYTAIASNEGDNSDVFALSTRNVPSGWSVVLPVDVLSIDDGESVEFPVVVSTPFSHEHGAAASFVVEMHSTRDPAAVGRVELGIRYPAIAQPSGHHNTLYLHGAAPPADLDGSLNTLGGATRWLTMDTLEDGASEPTPGAPNGLYFNDDLLPMAPFVWHARLDPGLQMGLAFDRTLPSQLAFPVSSTTPLSQATLTARLFLWTSEYPDGFPYSTEEEVDLMWFNTSAVEIAANSQHVFEAVPELAEDLDTIPFDPAWGLGLEVRLEAVGVNTLITNHAAPVLMPGGRIQMPLVEYRDPVEDIFESLAGPTVDVVGGAERLLNPGETILVPLRLGNGANETRELVVQVSGRNAMWADITGGSMVRVGALDDRNVTLAITAPVDAREGDGADLVVQVRARGDDDGRALVRIVATVTTTQDIADEAATRAVQGSSGKDSPGAGLGLAALALVAVALVVRSRRAT